MLTSVFIRRRDGGTAATPPHTWLAVPGKQPIGMLVTILVGIVSAFLGTALARAIGVPTATNGIDWLELVVQVIVAALGVVLAANRYARRGRGATRY